MGEKWPIKFSLQCDFHGNCRGFFHAAKLRHGSDGFTVPPKEGMLRIFSPKKFDGQHSNHQTTEAASSI
jgi:hypothetical protein